VDDKAHIRVLNTSCVIPTLTDKQICAEAQNFIFLHHIVTLKSIKLLH